MARDWEPIDYAWPTLEDIDWLRAELGLNWSASYPQPYIGVGPDDAAMSLYWKTTDETVTLEIDTVAKVGDLYRAPNHAVGEEEVALDMDLTGATVWQQIASALGVEFARYRNVLVTGLDRPVSKGRNIGRRFSTENEPKTTGPVYGRPWTGRSTGAGRTARYTRYLSFKSRMGTTRRRYRLQCGKLGRSRRHTGVRTGAS